jgi:hypothetical protein
MKPAESLRRGRRAISFGLPILGNSHALSIQLSAQVLLSCLPNQLIPARSPRQVNARLAQQPGRRITAENLVDNKKMVGKSTYPPPADGLCVLFFCKLGCSANDPAAQAGRGALQGIGECTECKVLKRNAGQLRNGMQGGRGRGNAVAHGFIGQKIGKGGFQRVLIIDRALKVVHLVDFF